MSTDTSMQRTTDGYVGNRVVASRFSRCARYISRHDRNRRSASANDRDIRSCDDRQRRGRKLTAASPREYHHRPPIVRYLKGVKTALAKSLLRRSGDTTGFAKPLRTFRETLRSNGNSLGRIEFGNSKRGTRGTADSELSDESMCAHNPFPMGVRTEIGISTDSAPAEAPR